MITVFFSAVELQTPLDIDDDFDIAEKLNSRCEEMIFA